ncbi:rRNA maturation RNase YbeY [Thermovenabulum gondwanense]|uniref:Endoribonuclease YbeY n=1 Tax=Thermovenabulum gondwanense TaxID=520767 RepID=A0A162MBN3_9FIRM|nr:rRNA maturation RNase YbeY [Thermovenabulum gondwanense]KYO65171.1 Endoribonuclease YbeY [Thermovenabulum gondwanense]
MSTVIINNLQDAIEIGEETEEIIKKVLMKALEIHGESGVEVSVVLVDNEYIRELNRIYRGKDEPTDVLSFAMREGEDEIEDEIGEELGENELLGDIVISCEKAKSQAEEYGHSFQREIGYLAVHGILHLLGYDHETEEEKQEMRSREEEVLSSIGLVREDNLK